ncbi:MAG: glycoside hydrolase family 11 protein [Spirochaetales bacterium]|nr:glycoside hydrolase family 11 protein [Spirochaetales bacterium]
MNVKKITALIALVLLCSTGFLTAQSICDNSTGQQGGYTYEYWKDQGSGCMELGSGGTFSINWNNINNLLARKGVRPGSKDNVVTYAADYRPNGNSYLCVYGWTRNPLVEYYIVESYGTWKPPGASPMGTFSSDGGTYEIFRTQRVNQPSIDGNTTFYQYWSVRTQKITSGTITVGNHFNAWAQKGMNMGSMYEVSFCVEGYQSSGTANVTKMEITTGGSNTPVPENTPTPVVTNPPTPTPELGPDAIVVRAVGTQGGENLDIKVGGATVASFTLTTTMEDYVTSGTGNVEVHYTNDDNVDNGMDVQLDYIIYHGTTMQAEDQTVNTAVWQDSSCGGSLSEMMHCSGYIAFPTGTEETPVPTETPTPTPPVTAEAKLAISPASKTVNLNSNFTLTVALSSNSKAIASYGIDVNYDSSLLAADTSTDADAAAAGTDGYIAAANASTPGKISITGFDVNGKGPGTNLNFLTIYLKSRAQKGTASVSIGINMITDPSTADVATATESGTVVITDGSNPGCELLGDGNNDGAVNIVDALLAAQLYVDPSTSVAAPDCLDVDCSGTVTIVDALLIAQKYVGSISSFDC